MLTGFFSTAGASDDERFGDEIIKDGNQSGTRGMGPHGVGFQAIQCISLTIFLSSPETSLRNLAVDNDIHLSQLVKKRAAEDKRRGRTQLQQSMVPPPSVSVEETLLDSSSSPSPPSPTKPYTGPRSDQNQHMGSVNNQVYSPPSSSSFTASTILPGRSLSQRRNINNLVIATGDISTGVNPRQQRVFSYIEGEAEVLATASDDRQHPFQDYYEFADTLRQQEGQSNSHSPTDTNGISLADRVSVSAVSPSAPEHIDNSSTIYPVNDDDSTTSFTGTSSRSSKLTGLSHSTSTGSVIWVGKRNSRAAAAAAAAAAAEAAEAAPADTTTTASSSTAQVDQPSFYETTSISSGIGAGIAVSGEENYELGEMPSTTTSSATAPSSTTTYYHYYNPTTTTTTATLSTSPRLAPRPGPGPGPGPAIPPRTTSTQQQQQQHKVGSVSPIKDRFEQLLFEQQKKQQQQQQQAQQQQTSNEKSPVRGDGDAAGQGRADRRTQSPNNNTQNKSSKVSATVAMFNDGT